MAEEHAMDESYVDAAAPSAVREFPCHGLGNIDGAFNWDGVRRSAIVGEVDAIGVG